MGTKPETPDYEAGNNCTHCNSVIFDDVTPKYIEVHISGVVACPLFPVPMPNGVGLLTQQEAPCNWIGGMPGFNMGLAFGAGQTHFLISFGALFYFESLILLPCQTILPNQQVCGFPAIAGHQGTAEFFWGPTIGP